MHLRFVLLISVFAVGALGHTNLRLDPDFNVMFHMTSVPGRMEIEVIARTTGWVGFGFSHSENATNTDMVIGYVNDTNNAEIYHADYWSPNNGTAFPILDARQDWFRNDTSCSQNATHTTLYYYRQLDTGDTTQDLVIPDEDVHLIWSYGASDTLDPAVRIVVYDHKINLVAGGTHDTGSATLIHGSIGIILLCVGFFVFH